VNLDTLCSKGGLSILVQNLNFLTAHRIPAISILPVFFSTHKVSWGSVRALLLPQEIFHMIRNGSFADHKTFQKATKETLENHRVLKRALVLIG
jgi:hypothetical protein